MAVAVSACFAAGGAQALPTDPQVVAGSATFSQTANVLTITNSNRAVINWNSFSINAGETTRFIQPSASSSVLNRVLGGDPSALLGTLSSNGKVWLINPAGILVGAGAKIDVAGFVASTLNITNENFLAGKMQFDATAGAGAVVNKGAITAPSGGTVYLVAPNVTNEGIINAPNGEVILAAGQTVNLIDTATPGVKVEVTGADGNVTNLGEVLSEAGRIGMAGVIVRNSGTLNASSVVEEGGRIFLKASRDAYVDGAGRIVTTGTKGGRVEVLGERVAVMDQASIDASGTNGGGTVLVGGDFQGKNLDIQNAQITYFGPEATIKADAIENGDGGKAILWADDTTRAYGNISARGGQNGGNGGFVEVSGKRYLTYRAYTDLRAPHGEAGTLLLDPNSINIVNAGTTDATLTSGAYFYGGGAATGTLTWADIQAALGSGNLIVYAQDSGSGYITVSESPYHASGLTLSREWGNWTTYNVYDSSNKLSLLADGQVLVQAGFGNRGTGAIDIMAGWNGNLTTPDVAGDFSAGKDIYINAQIATNGPLTLKAGNAVTLDNAGGNYAGIEMNSGALNIVADKLILDASVYGGGGYTPGVRIVSTGNQVFDIGRNGGAGVLQLKGNNISGAYGGSASIDRYYSASSTGGQVFNLHYGADVHLIGGSGDGYYNHAAVAWPWSGTDCAIAVVCSSNSAEIENEGLGGQTFNATAPGTVITLTAGSNGNNNGAWIENELGTQRIQGSIVANRPALELFGGTSGGSAIVYGGELREFDNGASIWSETGTQIIEVASLTMTGGTADYGGVSLGGRTQDIKVTGDVALTGGGVAAPVAASGTGEMVFKSGAFIGGDDESGSTHSLTMTIGGNLTMTGGATNEYGGSPAAIGSYQIPVNATINVYGGIAMNGSDAGYDRIGSWGGLGGQVTLRSGLGGAGAMNLGKGWIGTGTSGSVTLVADGTGAAISQDVLGAIMTATLNASTLTSIGSIDLQGENKVNTFIASSTNQIAFTNAQSFTASSVTATSAANGAVTLTSLYGGNISLGTISAGYGATIDASGAIYETNGVGVTDITAGVGGVELFSWNGGTGGASLAISADIATPGPIASRVYNSAGYGGIRIQNTVGVPSDIWIQDDSAYNPKVSFYNNASWTVGVNHSFIVTNPGELALGSANVLTIGSDGYVANDGNVALRGSTVVIDGGFVASDYGNLSVNAGTLNVYGGGELGAWMGNVALNVGTLRLSGSGSAVEGMNLSATVANNIYVNDGAYIAADNNVSLTLTSASSTIYLNETTGMAASAIYSNEEGITGYGTRLSFPGRSGGGIVIDGVQTTRTIDGGSGIYAAGLPASSGAGLIITYGQGTSTVTNQVTTAINNSTSSTQTSTTTSTQQVALAGTTTTTTTVVTTAPTTTTGGTEGTFGSTSTSGDTGGTAASTSGTTTGGTAASGDSANGEGKEGNGEKGSKQDTDKGKKDDKPAAKKVSQCT